MAWTSLREIIFCSAGLLQRAQSRSSPGQPGQGLNPKAQGSPGRGVLSAHAAGRGSSQVAALLSAPRTRAARAAPPVQSRRWHSSTPLPSRSCNLQCAAALSKAAAIARMRAAKTRAALTSSVLCKTQLQESKQCRMPSGAALEP